MTPYEKRMLQTITENGGATNDELGAKLGIATQYRHSKVMATHTLACLVRAGFARQHDNGWYITQEGLQELRSQGGDDE